MTKKLRRNLSVSPETAEVLDGKGNASEWLDALVAYAVAFRLPEEAVELRRAVVERARSAEPPS